MKAGRELDALRFLGSYYLKELLEIIEVVMLTLLVFHLILLYCGSTTGLMSIELWRWLWNNL